jgi:hypothetical protein
MARADRYLIAGVLVIAVLSAALLYGTIFPRQSGTVSSRAVIKAQGRLVRRIELSTEGKKATFTLRGKMGPATVEVEGKRIRMSEAPCRDRICVGRGWIEKPGESIVCIPNEIHIYIESGDALDAVTR